VLKARQMGMTTWMAGRFFLRTITARGVLTVQVAQNQQAVESIFGIVQRMWENLPTALREGPLVRSRANVGQMVFPELDSEFRVLSAANENAGRGLTVQYMHLSEVSRWPGDAAATLAGLRAALVPSGELVLESTPNGAHGCFYEEWQHAAEKGMQRHFFPWWMEPAYVSAAVTDLRDDELALMREHGLTAAQIGFRRSLEAGYRGLRVQESPRTLSYASAPQESAASTSMPSSADSRRRSLRSSHAAAARCASGCRRCRAKNMSWRSIPRAVRPMAITPPCRSSNLQPASSAPSCSST